MTAQRLGSDWLATALRLYCDFTEGLLNVPSHSFLPYLSFSQKTLTMQPTPAPGIVLQSCSGRQFAAAYGITYKVFRRLLKENNLYYKRTAKKFTLLEVVQITAKLGMPTRPLVKEDL